MAPPAPGRHPHHLSFPFRSPTPLKTRTRFPTWCWEHLRVGFLQQLHGELRVISAELEDKATKRKAQRPCRGGTLQGRFLLRGRREPIPRELVGPRGSPRPPGLVRHQDPWELCSAWRDLPFFDWCPTPKRMFLPAQVEDGGRLEHLSEKHMGLSGVWISPGSSCSLAKRWLGKKGDAKSQRAGEKRPVLQMLPAAGVYSALPVG